jgi:hypothetical protein
MHCVIGKLLRYFQVVDARDPLTYRSEDLERYARALHPTKRSLLLLNKADLLPETLRSAWADHIDSLGLDYVFWSAKSGMDEESTGAIGAGLPSLEFAMAVFLGLVGVLMRCSSVPADEDARATAAARQKLGKDPRARVLGVDDLLILLERRAAQAAAEAEAQGINRVSVSCHNKSYLCCCCHGDIFRCPHAVVKSSSLSRRACKCTGKSRRAPGGGPHWIPKCGQVVHHQCAVWL